MAENIPEIFILSSSDEEEDTNNGNNYEECPGSRTQQSEILSAEMMADDCQPGQLTAKPNNALIWKRNKAMKVVIVGSSSESDDSDSHPQLAPPKIKLLITEDEEEDECVLSYADMFDQDENPDEASSCNNIIGGHRATPIMTLCPAECQSDQNQLHTKNMFQAIGTDEGGPKLDEDQDHGESVFPIMTSDSSDIDDDHGERESKYVPDSDSECKIIQADTLKNASPPSIVPRSINKLLDIVKIKLEKEEIENVQMLERQIWSKYEVIRREPMGLQKKLSKAIESSAEKIKKVSTSGDEDDIPIWEHIFKLFDHFSVEKSKLMEEDQIEGEEEYDETAMQKYEEDIGKKIIVLEGILNGYVERIKNCDEQEVDLDDIQNDHNSAYMRRDRLISKYMKIYNLLCSISHSSKRTGRPIEWRISISESKGESITMYPELDSAVEKFINSSKRDFTPDFWDILKIIKDENADSSLHLSEDVLNKQAAILHKYVVSIIQTQRDEDLRRTIPSMREILLHDPDPAETDPELERKLRENLKKGKNINQAIKEFEDKDKNLPREVVDDNDNVDDSPATSGDEDDEDFIEHNSDSNPEDYEGRFDTKLDEDDDDHEEENLDRDDEMGFEEFSPPTKKFKSLTKQ